MNHSTSFAVQTKRISSLFTAFIFIVAQGIAVPVFAAADNYLPANDGAQSAVTPAKALSQINGEAEPAAAKSSLETDKTLSQADETDTLLKRQAVVTTTITETVTTAVVPREDGPTEGWVRELDTPITPGNGTRKDPTPAGPTRRVESYDTATGIFTTYDVTNDENRPLRKTYKDKSYDIYRYPTQTGAASRTDHYDQGQRLLKSTQADGSSTTYQYGENFRDEITRDAKEAFTNFSRLYTNVQGADRSVNISQEQDYKTWNEQGKVKDLLPTLINALLKIDSSTVYFSISSIQYNGPTYTILVDANGKFSFHFYETGTFQYFSTTNGVTTEYDSQGRPYKIRDNQGQLVREFDYNLNRTKILSYSAVEKGNQVLTLLYEGIFTRDALETDILIFMNQTTVQDYPEYKLHYIFIYKEYDQYDAQKNLTESMVTVDDVYEEKQDDGTTKILASANYANFITYRTVNGAAVKATESEAWGADLDVNKITGVNQASIAEFNRFKDWESSFVYDASNQLRHIVYSQNYDHTGATGNFKPVLVEVTNGKAQGAGDLFRVAGQKADVDVNSGENDDIPVLRTQTVTLDYQGQTYTVDVEFGIFLRNTLDLTGTQNFGLKMPDDQVIDFGTNNVWIYQPDNLPPQSYKITVNGGKVTLTPV